MPYLYTPAQYAAARQRLGSMVPPGGNTTLSMPMYQFIYVATSDEEAQHLLATRLQQTYQQPFARLVPKYCTAGTPATCRASLQAYADAGVREFILTPPVTSPHEFRQQLDLYASEIFPALRLP